ncbi:MAG: hypothetical protein RIB64_06310 [Arenibacter algicola]
MGIDVRDFPDTVQEYFESINSMVVFQEAFKGGPNNPFINDLRKVWREELERQIIENETPTISSGYTEMFGAHLSQLIIIYSDLYCLIVAEEKDKNKYIRKIERNSNNLKSVVEININNIYYPEYYKTQVNSIQQFVNSIGVTWSTSPICGFYSASIEKLSELTRNGDRNKLLETVHDGPRVSRIVDWSLVHFINRDFLCASKRLIHLIPKVKTRVQKYGVSLEFQVFNIDGFEYIIERDETGPGRFMVANFEYIDKWLKRYAFLLNEQKLIAEDDNTIFIKIMHEASNLDSTFIKPIARHLQDIIINIHSFHRPPFDPTTFKILGNLEVLALIKENLIGWWEYDIYDKYIDSWNGFWLDLRTALNKMNISEFIKFKDILVSEISRYNIESASNGFYLGNNPWGIDLLEMPGKIDSFCLSDVNQKISLEMLKVNQIDNSRVSMSKENNLTHAKELTPFRCFFVEGFDSDKIRKIHDSFKDLIGRQIACLIYLLQSEEKIVVIIKKDKKISRKHFVNSLKGEFIENVSGVGDFFVPGENSLRFIPDNDDSYIEIKRKLKQIL